MKILQTNPPSSGKRKIIRAIDCSHEAKADYLWQPNDFMIISSLLKKEDEITFIDGTADFLEKEEYLGEFAGVTADLVFFALSSVCWESDLYYFRKIKNLFPHSPIFVIGDIFLETEYQEMMLQECDGIVFQPNLLQLEKMAKIRKEKPENCLPGLCQKAGENIFSWPGSQASESTFPRHEVYQKDGYCFPFAKKFQFATVTTMWGCPFTCSYCTDSKIPPAVRPYESVLDELEHLDKMGIDELFFADKTFGYPKENTMPLLKVMAEKYKFSWSCYFHPQFYSPELIKAMNDAGCHTIIIGIDSANLPSLKKYKRKVQQGKVDGLLIEANKYNWNICADFILGLPHETEEDIIDTLNYGVKLPIDFASFNIAAPLPGSDIREQAKSEGKLEFGKEGYDTFGHEVVLETNYVNVPRLLKLRKKAIVKFYLRPSQMLRRLKRTSSFEHFRIQFNQMYAMLIKSKLIKS